MEVSLPCFFVCQGYLPDARHSEPTPPRLGLVLIQVLLTSTPHMSCHTTVYLIPHTHAPCLPTPPSTWHTYVIAGIGSVRSGLHPVQAALANSHGSQCGFCTPGFVMSMYSMLRSRAAQGLESPDEEEIEECLAGNLWCVGVCMCISLSVSDCLCGVKGVRMITYADTCTQCVPQ